MTSRRFFSNNDTKTFDEYLREKKSAHILKSLKENNETNFRTRDIIIQDKKIKYYFSYRNFIDLINMYFKNVHKKLQCKAPMSINDSKRGFKCYEIIKNHISECSFCQNVSDIHFFSRCKEIKDILYPYGNYIDNKSSCIQFPGKIDLNEWCKEKDIVYQNIEEEYIQDNQDSQIIEDNQDSQIIQKECNCDCEIKDDINNKVFKINTNNFCNEYDDRYYIKMKNRINQINNNDVNNYESMNKSSKNKFCGVCNKTTNLFVKQKY
jgi:hypothetical protein